MHSKIGTILFLSTGVIASAMGAQATRKLDQILVKVKPGFSDSVAANAIGGTVKRRLGNTGYIVVGFPALTESQLDAKVSRARALRAVAVAEPDRLFYPTAVPNDPLFSRQYGPQLIRAPRGWDFGVGRASVVVGVVDSGFDKTHEDLSPVLVTGRDFADGDDDVTEDAGPNAIGHGTHVAGIVGAASNNRVGIASVGYGISVMPLKTWKKGEEGSAFSVIIEASAYAVDRGVKVINMSLGAQAEVSQADRDMVAYATRGNAVIVAATGNSNQNIDTIPHTPANTPGVFAVSSSDRADRKSDFSNFGTRSDIAAPGTDILSLKDKGGYIEYSGTSMATPLVAGALGLMLSYNPRVTVFRAVQAMKLTAVRTVDSGGRNYTSNGRLDLAAAMQLIKPGEIRRVLASDAWTTVPTTARGQHVSLNEVDRNSISAQGVSQSVGSVVVAMAEFPVVQSGFDLSETSLRLVASANTSNVTQQLYLRDFTARTSKFDLIRAVPLMGDGVTKFELGRTMPAKYIDTTTGKIQVMVRALRPRGRGTGLSYTYNLDQLVFDGKYTEAFAGL